VDLLILIGYIPIILSVAKPLNTLLVEFFLHVSLISRISTLHTHFGSLFFFFFFLLLLHKILFLFLFCLAISYVVEGTIIFPSLINFVHIKKAFFLTRIRILYSLSLEMQI